jgi:hypothetical protein
MFRMMKDTECPICFDEDVANDLAITDCGHTFHEHCIDEYIAFNKSKRYVECPVCRAVIFENLEVISQEEEHRDREPPVFNEFETKMIGLLFFSLLMISVLIYFALF